MITLSVLLFLLVIFLSVSVGCFVGMVVLGFIKQSSDDYDYEQMMEEDGK
jgi:NhaP-type Na+/H+ or K+/H+ antiporter